MRTLRVAVIGTGEMGGAIARRLRDGGAAVVSALEGRGAASRERIARAGVRGVETLRAAVAEADIVLSIVPPGQARAVARDFAASASAVSHPLTFVDCNAVAPATMRAIAASVSAAGADVLDAGIVGAPPRPGEPSPIFYVSGPHVERFAALGAAGLDVRPLTSEIGAASALKLSYAGVTKGITALCALMQQHADAHGLGAELIAALSETRPDLWHFLERSVPAMRPKAYRWVDEMREIAAYTAPDAAGERIFEGAARFYATVAAERVRSAIEQR